ncbi:MAG: hypothetical protein CME65_09110 [Halobacteriovoraceae bacterium]|nr:hypothetical protein [Halobacteriovoraceae bacterium]|tara:strand:- start:7403 stop:9784 length:2382 start_codon:yes stop_codon:yes gene_type:complete
MPKELCDHCQEKIVVSFEEKIAGEVKRFCCNGCRTVYKILSENDLKDYYKIREGRSESISQANQKEARFKYLDDEEFKKKFLRSSEKVLQFSFYIEGVHCAACLWVLEKLPELNPNIISARLNMSTSTLSIEFNESANLSEIAVLITQLGYYPHPLLAEIDSVQLKKQETKRDVIRIAIAFFCMGNIMLFAVSNYLGAEPNLKIFFDIFSGILFLPILFYSSTPFFLSALGSIRSKQLSIDLPIALALIMGSVLSYYSLLIGQHHIYFDTLATLVFLILLSRFLLKASQQSSLTHENIYSFASQIPARKLEEGNAKETYARFIKINDYVEIHAGETIPIDGVITQGTSSTNNALITGEINPIEVKSGDQVFSGCINNSATLVVKATSTLEKSELGKALKQIEKGWQGKTSLMRLSDKITKYFVILQLLIAVITFIYFFYVVDFETAYLRALTLIIITCPCALGFTPPLTLTIALSKLAKNGILVKDERVLENINQCQDIFFDKTGTLTKGNFQIIKWESLSSREEEERLLYSLEENSKHPIAKSLRQFVIKQWNDQNKKLIPIQFKKIEEIPGKGISAINENGDIFEIKPFGSQSAQTSFSLSKNDQVLANIYLEDEIYPDAKAILEELRSRFNTYLLSGDNESVVKKVGTQLNFEPDKSFFSKTPQQKMEIIKSHPLSIMVGDGANDAVAINSALVGVAVSNSMDLSLRASHVYFNQNNSLQSLKKLIIVANETERIIKRNVSFSLIYNLAGVYLAIIGVITPLLAAILMPLSSFTVLASSLFTTKRMRNNT